MLTSPYRILFQPRGLLRDQTSHHWQAQMQWATPECWAQAAGVLWDGLSWASSKAGPGCCWDVCGLYSGWYCHSLLFSSYSFSNGLWLVYSDWSSSRILDRWGTATIAKLSSSSSRAEICFIFNSPTTPPPALPGNSSVYPKLRTLLTELKQLL